MATTGALPRIDLTTRRPFGPQALEFCGQALASGNLSSTGGPLTARFEQGFQGLYGSRHAVAVSSGTAAIHCALGALGAEPGGEVILGPITDAGSVLPLLHCGLIPRFVDLDRHLAMPADAVADAITERTVAIMAIHLFGGITDTAALRGIADRHSIFLLEDCAQAHVTALGDRYVGTYGHIGMFSFQQSKHLTTGDGGMCITDDDELAGRMRLFRDKGWDRGSSGSRAYPQLGLNYRITELQSAAGLPQLDTVQHVVSRRRELAARLDGIVERFDGVSPWRPPEAGSASYWCYPLLSDDPAHRDSIAATLAARGVPVTAGYIGAPIAECMSATREHRTFGSSQWPFTLADRPVDYAADALPMARDALDRMIVFWMHEDMADAEVDAVGAAIRDAVHQARGQRP